MKSLIILMLLFIMFSAYSETKLYFEYTEITKCRIDGKPSIVKLGEFTDKDLIRYKGFEIIREANNIIVSREYWLIEENEWLALCVNKDYNCFGRLFILSDDSYINDCNATNLLNIFYDFYFVKRDNKIFVFEPKKVTGSYFLFTIEF